MSKDAKIGLWTVFVLVAFVLFNSVKESGLIDFNDEIGLLFTQVHGLRPGDPVTIGGVPSGRVLDIDFAPQEIQESLAPITGGTTLVRAMVSIDRHIPRESTYAVRVDLNGRRWLAAIGAVVVLGAAGVWFVHWCSLSALQLSEMT